MNDADEIKPRRRRHRHDGTYRHRPKEGSKDAMTVRRGLKLPKANKPDAFPRGDGRPKDCEKGFEVVSDPPENPERRSRRRKEERDDKEGRKARIDYVTQQRSSEDEERQEGKEERKEEEESAECNFYNEKAATLAAEMLENGMAEEMVSRALFSAMLKKHESSATWQDNQDKLVETTRDISSAAVFSAKKVLLSGGNMESSQIAASIILSSKFREHYLTLGEDKQEKIFAAANLASEFAISAMESGVGRDKYYSTVMTVLGTAGIFEEHDKIFFSRKEERKMELDIRDMGEVVSLYSDSSYGYNGDGDMSKCDSSNKYSESSRTERSTTNASAVSDYTLNRYSDYYSEFGIKKVNNKGSNMLIGDESVEDEAFRPPEASQSKEENTDYPIQYNMSYNETSYDETFRDETINDQSSEEESMYENSHTQSMYEDMDNQIRYDVTVEDMTVEDVTLDHVVVEDVTVEDMTVEDVTVEDVTVEDATVEDTLRTLSSEKSETDFPYLSSYKSSYKSSRSDCVTVEDDCEMAIVTYGENSLKNLMCMDTNNYNFRQALVKYSGVFSHEKHMIETMYTAAEDNESQGMECKIVSYDEAELNREMGNSPNGNSNAKDDLTCGVQLIQSQDISEASSLVRDRVIFGMDRNTYYNEKTIQMDTMLLNDRGTKPAAPALRQLPSISFSEGESNYQDIQEDNKENIHGDFEQDIEDSIDTKRDLDINSRTNNDSLDRLLVETECSIGDNPSKLDAKETTLSTDHREIVHYNNNQHKPSSQPSAKKTELSNQHEEIVQQSEQFGEAFPRSNQAEELPAPPPPNFLHPSKFPVAPPFDVQVSCDQMSELTEEIMHLYTVGNSGHELAEAAVVAAETVLRIGGDASTAQVTAETILAGGAHENWGNKGDAKKAASVAVAIIHAGCGHKKAVNAVRSAMNPDMTWNKNENCSKSHGTNSQIKCEENSKGTHGDRSGKSISVTNRKSSMKSWKKKIKKLVSSRSKIWGKKKNPPLQTFSYQFNSSMEEKSIISEISQVNTDIFEQRDDVMASLDQTMTSMMSSKDAESVHESTIKMPQNEETIPDPPTFLTALFFEAIDNTCAYFGTTCLGFPLKQSGCSGHIRELNIRNNCIPFRFPLRRPTVDGINCVDFGYQAKQVHSDPSMAFNSNSQSLTSDNTYRRPSQELFEKLTPEDDISINCTDSTSSNHSGNSSVQSGNSGNTQSSARSSVVHAFSRASTRSYAHTHASSHASSHAHTHASSHASSHAYSHASLHASSLAHSQSLQTQQTAPQPHPPLKLKKTNSNLFVIAETKSMEDDFNIPLLPPRPENSLVKTKRGKKWKRQLMNFSNKNAKLIYQKIALKSMNPKHLLMQASRESKSLMLEPSRE